MQAAETQLKQTFLLFHQVLDQVVAWIVGALKTK